MNLDMKESIVTFLNSVTDRAKETRDKLEKAFGDLKLKMEDFKRERLKFVDSWEDEISRKATDILSKLKLAQIPQEQDLSLEPNFSAELQAEFQQLNEEFNQNHFKIEYQSSHSYLSKFCRVNYAPVLNSESQCLPIGIPLSKCKSLPIQENVEVFDRYLNVYRNYKHRGLSINLKSHIPDTLMAAAKKCVALPLKKKYSLVNYFVIIVGNLNQGKELDKVLEGFTNLAKISLCLYLNPKLEEIKSFCIDLGFYKNNIADNLSSFQDILNLLGYEPFQNNWELNANPKKRMAQIEQMGCELFILQQEIAEIESMNLEFRDIISHFNNLSSEFNKHASQRHKLPVTKYSSFGNLSTFQNIEDASKSEFLDRVKNVKSDIKIKFERIRNQLDDKQLTVQKRIEEIEREIIKNYEKSVTTLKEITQARENIRDIFRSNASNYLRRKNVEMYDREIAKIRQDSKIDSTFEVIWKMENLGSSSDFCEIFINENIPPIPPPRAVRRAISYENVPLLMDPLNKNSY